MAASLPDERKNREEIFNGGHCGQILFKLRPICRYVVRSE